MRGSQIAGLRRRCLGSWGSAWGVGAGVLLLIGAIAAGGCGTKTEDGYDPPHRLGMSEAALRALYAPEFTQEARAAEGDKENQLQSHREHVPGGL